MADNEESAGEARGATTRRAMIAGVAAGLTGLVAESIVTAQPAGATGGNPVILGAPNPATTVTEIINTNPSPSPGTAALKCDDGGSGVGPAIVAELTNASNPAPAIQALAAGGGAAVEVSTATVGAGILATTTGAGYAIQALTEAPTATTPPSTALFVGDNNVGIGQGLEVHLQHEQNDENAMVVTTDGGGYAIYAQCTLTTNAKAVIAAWHGGLGPVLEVTTGTQINTQPTIVVSTMGHGPAIAATDVTGGLGGGITSAVTQTQNYSAPFTALTQGRGPAIRATVDNPASGGHAFEGTASGAGSAVSATTTGTGAAIEGIVSNSKNKSAAVSGTTNGSGSGVTGSALSPTGVGVRATSTAGKALEVDGRVSFSRSGLADIRAHGRSARVDLAGVTPQSMVFANIQQLSGSVAVANVVPAANSFTINLSEAAPSALRVAWMILD